jgi:5'-deoxynucleotidase YfbR-like HD superfamily hydrolase
LSWKQKNRLEKCYNFYSCLHYILLGYRLIFIYKIGHITLARRTQHGVAQNIFQSALVAAALAFQPFQQVGITSHGKLVVDGLVQLAAVRSYCV